MVVVVAVAVVLAKSQTVLLLSAWLGPGGSPTCCCLAENDGTRQYASCLCFFEDTPSIHASRHEALLGSKASKVICLLSHQPYLATMEKVRDDHRPHATQRALTMQHRGWMIAP